MLKNNAWSDDVQLVVEEIADENDELELLETEINEDGEFNEMLSEIINWFKQIDYTLYPDTDLDFDLKKAVLDIYDLTENYTEDLDIVNRYLESNRYNIIYDDLKELIRDNFSDPYDAVEAFYLGDADMSCSYYTLDGYCHIKCFDDLDDEVDEKDVLEYVFEYCEDEINCEEYDYLIERYEYFIAAVKQALEDSHMVDKG